VEAYRVTFINDQARLAALAAGIEAVGAVALDIETAEWWDRRRERVSLVQLAYRREGELRVAVIDALTPLDLATLRRPLELVTAVKAVHNAAYDAARLARHYEIKVSPVHDTMLAARRAGERRYSLKAQAETHLGMRLDKGEQRADWGQRPLGPRQIAYAAADAAATLLLYEHQTGRGLRGDYRPRGDSAVGQGALPLSEPTSGESANPPEGDGPRRRGPEGAELSDVALALLGIVTELPSRYYPEQLAASVGGARVGLAGWIIDQVLGREADVDESVARDEIAGLCRMGLVRITPTRRLEAEAAGASVWRRRRV
jgi:hypothetical protein